MIALFFISYSIFYTYSAIAISGSKKPINRYDLFVILFLSLVFATLMVVAFHFAPPVEIEIK